jgi:hypothetical protein
VGALAAKRLKNQSNGWFLFWGEHPLPFLFLRQRNRVERLLYSVNSVPTSNSHSMITQPQINVLGIIAKFSTENIQAPDMLCISFNTYLDRNKGLLIQL